MTEIYGTLGPACADTETLCAMLRRGMTGVRLNLSHSDLPSSAPVLAKLREAERITGLPCDLLIDMQGPELRIGILPEPLELTAGEDILLGDGGIPVPEAVKPCLTPGQTVLLDDGKLRLEMTDGGKARVLRGGVLASRKSIALPGAALWTPTMTESDRENIRLALSCGVTGVMQPFVRCREDLEEVRRALNESGGENIRLFAKIENMAGVENLPSLLGAADVIVIARGDLGNAMPLWELPAVQKRIAKLCREAGKPFMVVTQMLSSMEHSPVPTRAEVSDIFNAVLDGAASVMVTGETAVGDYPAEVIRYLKNTADSAVGFD